MKPKLILCLALALSGGLFGCATKPNSIATDSEQIKLPIKFAGYRELYTFIAKHANGGEDLTTDEKTIFKLAADSKTEIIALSDDVPYAYVVESRYYNGGIIDQIRGAQGNGQYYILRPLATNYTELDTDKGFELIGIVDGNTWTLSHTNGKAQIVTTWHSPPESSEMVYEWNGKFFDRVK